MKADRHKILIADGDKAFLSTLKAYKQRDSFTVEWAAHGQECLTKIEHFKPDLVIVDLMLPGMHGIEILQRIKNSILPSKTGVILTCYHGMIQNYHSALKLGAHYFLQKPCIPSTLFHLCHQFFAGTLHPTSFPSPKQQRSTSSLKELSPLDPPSYLKLWGTRGSNPVSGPQHVRFGGNTSCLEIRHGKDLVIIDTGSGTRGLSQALQSHPQSAFHILLSHTHWDHLLGFPFFYPIYQPGQEIHIWAPVGYEKTTKELFSDMLAYAYFPVSLSDIQSKILFQDLRDSQTMHIGSIRIETHYAFHPGSTLCFKITLGNKRIGYVTDNEFLLGCHLPPSKADKKKELFIPYQSQINFLSDCDILFHEAQYLPHEYAKKVGWGHSSIGNAALLIKKAGIRHWIVVHHDPDHDDEQLLCKHQMHLDILEQIKHDCLVQMGHDGMLIPIYAK